MSQSNASPRTSPDHTWVGTPAVASGNDVADAVAHMKAWFEQKIAAIKTDTGPAVSALESRVADLEGKLKAALSHPAPQPAAPAPVTSATTKASDA